MSKNDKKFNFLWTESHILNFVYFLLIDNHNSCNLKNGPNLLKYMQN